MSSSAKCHVCGNSNGKYICPRCNILYCSVSCYQSGTHLQCSEQFYEKWVQEELKNCESVPQAKHKMLEILKHQNQETDQESDSSLDSDDEESVPDLADRMLDVNLDDDEAVWEKLTPDEKHEFRKLVASGNIIKILPEWEPWWKTKKRKALIQECEEEENVDWKSLCPPVSSDIPHLSKLSKSEPSPNVAFMVFNVLASYMFTVRWFKGTHKEMPVEGISTCIALSATLRNNEVFKNPLEAYLAFENDVSKCAWVKDAEHVKALMQEDLSDIIHGSDGDDHYFSIKAALSDLDSLCSLAIVALKKSKTNHLKKFSGSPPKVSCVQLISRKMIYYLSWITDHGSLLANILRNFSP